MVTNDALFAAEDAVVLNDEPGGELTVGVKALFVGVSLAVGSAGAFNAGRLNFNSTGVVTIQEDSSTEIAMNNTAGSLDLRSAGDITDASSTSITISTNAVFTTTDAILLSDQSRDVLVVGGDKWEAYSRSGRHDN